MDYMSILFIFTNKNNQRICTFVFHNYLNMDTVLKKKSFIEKFNNEGFVIVENVLSKEFISKAKEELEIAIKEEVNYHQTTDYSYYGYVLLNAVYGGAFLELFDNNKLIKPINTILGEGSIAYSYTSSSMPPFSGNSSSKIHTDINVFIPNYILRMGVLIALDDFTEENGATRYLPKSHIKEDSPSEEEFAEKSKLLNIKAGTAWFFHTRLWHAGGKNTTDTWRHALTINMCRPWMKQRIDIPTAMENNPFLKDMSETAKQKLGFYSQIPRSYDEYFAPPEKRRFKQSNI